MKRFLLNICWLLALLFLPAYANGAGRAIANVFLNQENKGDYFFILTKEGRLLFSPGDLLAMGIREIPQDARTGEEGLIFLDSLSPAVSYEFNEKESTLRLIAAPEFLGRTTVDLSRKKAVTLTHSGKTSAFLNYALHYSADAKFDFSSLTAPLEMGFTSNGYLGISNFIYARTSDEEKFVRLLTSFVMDDPAELRRLTFGDFTAHSGLLGSGGILGGVSLSTNFSLDPYMLRYPGLDFHGTAISPSDVEIYVNGQMVKKEHVRPGEFDFLNLTNVSGAGEAVLVIRDAFGQEERYTVPYYASAMLLNPGLQDYSYNLGFKRENLGMESFDYTDLAFLSFHRFGILRTFTGGFRAEVDTDVINFGPMATFIPGRLGEIDTSLAYSNSHGDIGYGGSASYFRAGRYFSGRLLARGFSRDYANISVSSEDDKPRLETAAGIGFRQSLFGSISISYSVKDMHDGVDRKRTSLFYNRRLTRDISFNLMAATTEAEKRTDEIFAGLMFLLGKSRSGHLGYRTQDGSAVAAATLQQNPPIAKGFGYRIGAERRYSDQDDDINGGNAFLQYRGDYGIYSADYRRMDGQESYTLNGSGGLALIGGSAYPTRPITDGFALVKVGDFENVSVMYNNQEIGKTGKSGEVLIPGLVSYHQNDISINDKDIPVNFEIREIRKTVSVPYRGSEIVGFELKRLQGFTGRLFVSEKGKRSEAEYWGLKIRVDKDAEELIVGKKGLFYLENPPIGDLRARLFTKDKECTFVLSIPKSEETMIDLGEVTCEMD